MTVEGDLLIDRRRLRRKLSFWRIIAFVAAAAAILAIGAVAAGPDFLRNHSNHIARIKIEGFIGDQTENARLFNEIAQSNARAVIVTIDSPGGATTGGEALYNGLRTLSASKPTVAVIDGLGASAAYLAALGTDHIVARRTSLVGSIGVLIQIPNVSTLLNTVGVKLEEVKSSPLKAAPNGLEPSSPEALAAMAALVGDTFSWFKGIVKERRGFDDAALATVADGRVFTGQQALDLKLIDTVGDETAAIAWLSQARKIDKNLPVRDWTPPGELGNLGLLHQVAGVALDSLGLHNLADNLRQADSLSGHALDGLVSVWHPAVEN